MRHSSSPIPTGKGAPDLATNRQSLGARLLTKPSTNRRGEWGGSYLKPIIWTVVLLSAVYVAVKTVPVLIAEYEFQDSLQTIARFASVNRQSDDSIRESILKEAVKSELPVSKEDIKIVGNAGNVRINVDYSVTVDLSLYQWTLNFHPSVSNDALF
jgi:Domain of unknown function (DUF4845)